MPAPTLHDLVQALPVLLAATKPSPAVSPGRPVLVPPDTRVLVHGVSGGCGESTVAALIPGAHGTGHQLPTGEDLPVLLVARTTTISLAACQAVLAVWDTQRSLFPLLGVVFVADSPGRLPPPVAALVEVISPAVPAVWRLGWVEPWRATTDPVARPGSVLAVVEAITAALDERKSDVDSH